MRSEDGKKRKEKVVCGNAADKSRRQWKKGPEDDALIRPVGAERLEVDLCPEGFSLFGSRCSARNANAGYPGFAR